MCAIAYTEGYFPLFASVSSHVLGREKSPLVERPSLRGNFTQSNLPPAGADTLHSDIPAMMLVMGGMCKLSTLPPLRVRFILLGRSQHRHPRNYLLDVLQH